MLDQCGGEGDGVPAEFTSDELQEAVTFGNVRAFYFADEEEFPMSQRVRALEYDPLFPLKSYPPCPVRIHSQSSHATDELSAQNPV